MSSPHRPRSSSRQPPGAQPSASATPIPPIRASSSFDKGLPHLPIIIPTATKVSSGLEESWAGPYATVATSDPRIERPESGGRDGWGQAHWSSSPGNGNGSVDAAAGIAQFDPPSMELRPTFTPSGQLGRVKDDPQNNQFAEAVMKENRPLSMTPPGAASAAGPVLESPIVSQAGVSVAQLPAAPGTGNPPVPFGLQVRTPAFEQLAMVQQAISDANELPPERESEKEKRLDQAWVELSGLLRNGNLEAQYFLALEFAKDSKWDEALKLFIMAARNGHAPSAYQAGLCFEHRRGHSTPNSSYARKMYSQAASVGYLPALYRLVEPNIRPGVGASCMRAATELQRREEGVDGDYLAVLLETAGEAGYINAWTRLGNIFEHGLYRVVPDPVKSYRFYRKAAERMDGEAMYRLAVIFEKGELTALVDVQRALKYYARAAERGVVGAMNRMGEVVEHGQLGVGQDIPQALQRYKEAAKKGSLDAMHHLARIQAGGLYGVGGGSESALAVFQKASSENNADATFALGSIFEKGQYGIPANIAESLNNYVKAADLGSAKAMIRLGRAHELGNLGFTVDVNRAVSYYKAASDMGDVKAQFLLAGFFLTGGSWMVRKSPEEAFKLVKKAVDGGCTEAEYRLGRLYESGTGTPVNMEKAMLLFRSAAQRGDSSALRKLNDLASPFTSMTSS
ncbi:HCP-like protein [Gonapodya prolifera JEL478]|uniref:HCP-like protein n=1 Tax=Gonapodya prolifera (strain JEL478) TaxID=1344416 RepID=A0A139A7P0_GONPJ|nr:HCP-like protein [Gonapodya prolifera JEL478]|eukprot:KXS12816.1 HCP-like protein [Gonapodya prolifera JEL478]